MIYYLQLMGQVAWEMVDAFVYKNANKAVNRDGSKRYRENAGIIKNGNEVFLHGNYSLEELAIITRFVGAEGKAPAKATVSQSFYEEPEFVRLKYGSSVKVHEIAQAA